MYTKNIVIISFVYTGHSNYTYYHALEWKKFRTTSTVLLNQVEGFSGHPPKLIPFYTTLPLFVTILLLQLKKQTQEEFYTKHGSVQPGLLEITLRN